MKRGCAAWVLVIACAGASDGGDGTTEAQPTTTGGLTTEAPASSSGAGSSSDTSTTSTSTPGSSGSGSDSGSGSGSVGGSTTGGEATFASCIDGVFVHGYPGIDFDAEGVQVGSHCFGTDHQDIAGVERVVFLGDSITVGTPPNDIDEYYRNIVADRLAEDFGLEFSVEKAFWQTPDPFDGQSIELHSGDFSSCAIWGGRNDDLVAGQQFIDCYPVGQRNLTTLTIMTSGGNDVAAMGRAGVAGATDEEVLAMAESAVAHMTDTLAWLTDPANFPNGSYVVFADVYDPTDGTGTLEDCELSPLVGFEDFELPAPEIMEFMQRSYAQLSVETGIDLVFLHKEFCGHGHPAADPAAPCYRGPMSPIWYDLSCSHPNPEGHAAIADMFSAVISE